MTEKYKLASCINTTIKESKRSSTDIFCLLIFIFFTLGLFIGGLYEFFQRKDIDSSIPYDVDGKGCGLDYPQYKYIYFPSPQADSVWKTTCVKQCPGQNDKTVQCQINSKVATCNQNNSAINSEAFHIYGTQIVRGTVCMPTSQILKTTVLDAINGYFILQLFDSVLKDWSLILLSILIIGFIALVCLLLIRLIGSYIIYLLYMLSFITFIGFGIYLALPNPQSSFAIKKNRPLSIALAALSVSLGLIVLFLYISYRQKIKGAIKYIMRANQFFKNNYIILLMPLLITGILVIFLLFWIFLTYSFYQPVLESNLENHLPFQHYQISTLMIFLLVLSFVYFIWCLFLLMHSSSFIISGTLISWKFKRQNPHLNAYKTFLISHLGSACTSSLLTCIFGLFKFQVDEAECTQVQQQSTSCCCINFFKKCYGAFCCCCINFLFKCFHHAAFSFVNLTANSYCQSSTEVAAIIRQQAVKWSTVLFLYRIINDFLPIILSILNVLLSNLIINQIQYFQTNTPNKFLLFIVIFITSYSASQLFLTIYSQSFQTIFILQYFHRNMQNKQKYAIQFEQDDQQQDKNQKSKQTNKKPN